MSVITSFCVTSTFCKKLSCCIGADVNLQISESGRSKVILNSCDGPCGSLSVVGSVIQKTEQISECLYKYTFAYDSAVLNTVDNPLVSSDIALATCC